MGPLAGRVDILDHAARAFEVEPAAAQAVQNEPHFLIVLRIVYDGTPIETDFPDLRLHGHRTKRRIAAILRGVVVQDRRPGRVGRLEVGLGRVARLTAVAGDRVAQVLCPLGHRTHHIIRGTPRGNHGGEQECCETNKVDDPGHVDLQIA